MIIKNQKGQPQNEIYKNEIYRRPLNRGRANLGRVFRHREIEAIKKFVRSPDRYITWKEWQQFLKTL